MIFPKATSFFVIGFALLQKSMLTSASDDCITPSGVDDELKQQVLGLLNGTFDGPTKDSPLPYLFLPLADPIINSLVSTYETPIQFRQALYHGSVCYNVAAMYDNNALDIWGRAKRMCEFESEEDQLVHEQLTTAYAFAYSALMVSPGSTDEINAVMNGVLQLPMDKLYVSEPDAGSPWSLAKAAVDEMTKYSETDGWNADGSLSHESNKMPFSDFEYGDYKPYTPAEASWWSLERQCDDQWSWEPLLESNGNGYFTKQEHVTPFAGFTGRLYGVSDEEYESFSIENPSYDYCEEAEMVLSETRDMSTDERKKIEIELFDSKFTSLLPMQIDWAIKNGFSSFDFWFYDMILITAMYDATLLVWREKVSHNAVRPTTVVHTLKGEEETKTYAGPFSEPSMVKGADWQPYIRTMPHAEYPSGSSCICTAYAETLQLLTGEDSTGAFQVGFTIPAGSSKTEPGKTPQAKMDLFYSTWSEVQEACGQSRLYGGMHFSKAIPAGEELCSGLSSLIVGRAEMLKQGDPSGALADFNDVSISVKRDPNECEGNVLFNMLKNLLKGHGLGRVAIIGPVMRPT